MPSATVAMPGSCGEMVQGLLDGTFFHVTCPVDIYSTVTVEIFPSPSTGEGQACPERSRRGEGARLHYPANRPKAGLALQKSLAHWQTNGAGACLKIRSPLPLSKGMASSTADVAGVIEAASAALGKSPAPGLVSQIAISIEPSDGTFFPGIVAFDHREGKMLLPLGTPPPIDILVFDCGGTVDTVIFNRIDRREILKRHTAEIKEAFAAVRGGLAAGDPELVGLGATLSARANQDVLLKPRLEKVIDVAREAGAAGVNAAHSGTVIGILLDRRKADSQAVASYTARRLEGMKLLFRTSLVGGGGRVVNKNQRSK